jgi:hypothetical protein
MIERPDSTELNAYVDGELPPDQAARVAQAIADDRELAKEVAALLRLKTATMAAFDREPPALPQGEAEDRSHRHGSVGGQHDPCRRPDCGDSRVSDDRAQSYGSGPHYRPHGWLEQRQRAVTEVPPPVTHTRGKG